MNIELLAIAFNHLYVLFPVIIRALTSYFSPTLDQTWDQKQQTEDALTIHQKRKPYIKSENEPKVQSYLHPWCEIM